MWWIVVCDYFILNESYCTDFTYFKVSLLVLVTILTFYVFIQALFDWVCC